MSHGKDFRTDLHCQKAKEKHAGVGDQASCRPGELLTNKSLHWDPNITAQKTRGTILQNPYIRRHQGLLRKDLQKPD